MDDAAEYRAYLWKRSHNNNGILHRESRDVKTSSQKDVEDTGILWIHCLTIDSVDFDNNTLLVKNLKIVYKWNLFRYL